MSEIVAVIAHEPTAAAVRELEGYRVIELTQDDAAPAGIHEARVLVPGFLAGTDATALMDSMPNLELVQLTTNGADIWVGKVPPGATLCTASGAHGGSTAEWAIAALLAVLHEFPQFVRRQDEGVWDRHLTDELAGKRVLILGAGDLGRQLQKRLEPFEVSVTLAARTAREGILSINQVPAVLPEHDVVVVMVPQTPQTVGLVDAAFLAAMPDGAVLVNAARGPIVDTDALIAELTSGRLRAALDVTDPEPLPTGHPLFATPNLFITPHIAGAVPGAGARTVRVVVEQLRRFAAGEELDNVVDARGY